MILLISTCKHRFSEEEFVKPIVKIINQEYEVKHFSEEFDANKYDKVIICGTALIDNDFLDHIDKFEFLKSIEIPILFGTFRIETKSSIKYSRFSVVPEIKLYNFRL